MQEEEEACEIPPGERERERESSEESAEATHIHAGP